MGRLGDLSPAASVAVGILVGICSTLIQSLGLTLQRKSHIQEESKPVQDERERRPPYRRRKWQIGMLMFIISNLVGSSIQITTLPLPVLSTLQASGLVFNTICASLILGEQFTKWSLIGTVMVAGGALLIALFGAVPEPTHTLEQLMDLIARPQFIVWMLGTGCIIAVVLGLAVFFTRLHNRSLQFHQHRNVARYRLWMGMSYGSVSAILSAHSLLVAKSAVELLVRTIVDQKNQFDRAPAWFILLALVALALSQLYFLHRGLKLASTSVLYPFVFCIYNIVAILDGLIYFNQVNDLTALHVGLIVLGTVILLGGVLALSWRLGDEEDADGEKTTSSVAPEAAHTLLTPGMGLVDDTTTEEEDNPMTATPSQFDSEEEDDEESRIEGAEQRPLLQRSASWRSLKRKHASNYQTMASPGAAPETPISPMLGEPAVSLDHSINGGPQPRHGRPSLSRLGTKVPRTRRARFAKEADEIWDELQDSPVSPHRARKLSSSNSGQLDSTRSHRRVKSDSAFATAAASKSEDLHSDEANSSTSEDDGQFPVLVSSPAAGRVRLPHRSKTFGPASSGRHTERRRQRWRSISERPPSSTDEGLKRSRTMPIQSNGVSEASRMRSRRRKGSLGGWLLDIWSRRRDNG